MVKFYQYLGLVTMINTWRQSAGNQRYTQKGYMLVGSSETIRQTSYWDDEIVRSIWRHMVQYDRYITIDEHIAV
jgi:hypothetical protein